MDARTRRLAERVLLGLIIGVAAIIVIRLVAFGQARMTREPPPFGAPLVDEQVTVPARPHDVSVLYSDPEAIRRRVTFTYRTEASGFRGTRTVVRPKPPGRFRIIALGECVTFGNGVDDDVAWPAQLEARLRGQAPGLDVEVVNAGLPRPPSLVLERLPELLSDWQPDLVLVSPGADLIAPEHEGPDGYRIMLPQARYDELLQGYERHLRQAVQQARQAGVPLVLVTPTLNSFFLPDGALWVDRVRRVAAAEQVPLLDSTALFDAVERQEGLVFQREEGVQRLVAAQDGVPTTILEVPYAGDRYVAPEVYRWLDAHPDQGPALSLDENHPTPRGHALIADALAGLLAREGLLPPTRP